MLVAAAPPAIATTAPSSCRDVLARNPEAPDGTYAIDPDGPGGDAPFVAYCDLRGGGWTLVLMAGSAPAAELGYNASYWVTDALLRPEVADPTQDVSMKNRGFDALPVTEARFCLGAINACVTERVRAPSLLALFRGDERQSERPVGDYAPWGYRGDLGCNRNGFNVSDVRAGPARFRYGILLNNEATCEGTVDGGRGFGGRGYYGTELSAGQGDGIVPTARERGWIFVR